MMLWFVAALATCEDPDLHLNRAEEDVLSFFLPDAQKSLKIAVAAFGCEAASLHRSPATFVCRA